MADTLLASGAAARTGGDSYQVVVHVDAAPLAEDKAGSCELEDGTALHPETARRLARRQPDANPGARRPAAVGQNGDRRELVRDNHRLGLTLTDTTCVPDAGDRLDRAWVVGLLCDYDPRLQAGERALSPTHADR